MTASRYLLTSAAEADIDGIIQHLAERSEDAPLIVYAAFIEAFELLGEHPRIGHTRKDLTERPLRFWSIHSYFIVYNDATAPLQIVAVVHGARDVRSLMKER
ncbi:type II toxin-antitoxin system RelE/ParE family toxin [Gemmatimonas aurantiaca]|uniref:type II toxin-antitoxin system RelE/ParE family toxin n=1 Tax=Gemmatimonas aurantiaca TaxID=173480 RepID=UPI00301CF904